MNLEVLRKEIEADEGCKYESYRCSEGYPTGGIGHLITEWDVDQLFAARQSGNSPVVLDVREDYELQIASLSDVIHIPLNEISLRTAEIPKDQELIVMCRSGERSLKVCKQLLSLGFDRVYNLRGGILDWSEKIDQTIQKY